MKRQRSKASKVPSKVPSTAGEPVTARKRRISTTGKQSKKTLTGVEKAKLGNDNGKAIHPPEQQQGDSSSAHPYSSLLTPHTLRLLKLIQDGSREHASMAALQLTTITAQSSTSPLVLWDVLGRLQAFLVAPSWQTRHNASVAMQGVARHLPPLSRQQFMQGVHVSTVKEKEGMVTAKQQQQQQQPSATSPMASSSSDNINNDTRQSDYLWLTLADIESELDAIVQNGRLLWAYAEQDQDTTTLQAEQYLHHLDQQQLQRQGDHLNTNIIQDGRGDGTVVDEFVQQRIQWQRRILAQRVGLSGLVQATATGTTGLFDTITAEDLDYSTNYNNNKANTVESGVPPVKSHSSGNKVEKKKPKRRRKRKGNSADDEEDMDETSKEFLNAQSVRALLVLEMQREQQQQQASSSSSSRRASSKGSSIVSHDNPQTLLATELLYRTFDPSWSIRHGALLGLLSLLRAWHTPNSTVADNTNTFGAWPQDIMARCLCILVLDRFGDYSGTTTTAVGIGGSESGCVVAPVRETAGQLLSMVWLLAPAHIQTGTLQLLYRLARGDTKNSINKGNTTKSNLAPESSDRSADWEIRHGALLALKYIVAVQVTSTSSTDTVRNNQHNMASHLSGIADVATKRLADTSDDVQSVAAQILSTLTTVVSYSIDSTTKSEVFSQLWKALASARNMSSSILDLMNLCSTLLHHQDCKSIMLIDQENRGGDTISGAKILDIFRAYLDHDLMTVRLAALRSISIAVMPLWKSLGDADSDSDSLVSALDSLQERLFISYLQDTATAAFANSDDKVQEETRQETSSPLATTPLDIFKSCRSQAWNNLVAVLSYRKEHQQEHRPPLESLSSRLIMVFFGVQLSKTSRDTFANGGQDYFPGLLSASEALSDVIWATADSTCVGNNSRSCHIDLLEVAMGTFIHSPWTFQCEAACLFLRSLLKRSGTSATKDRPLLRRLQSCRQAILAALTATGKENAPLCLATEHVLGGAVRDPGVLKLRDSAFLNGIKLLQTSSATSKVEDTIANIKGLWKAVLISKLGGEAIYTTATSDIAATNSSMKLMSVMAGASLAGGDGYFPTEKATPIIRPIMTSLKNETDQTRLHQSAEYMVELLLLMFIHGTSDREQDLSPFAKAREKILSTICNHLGSLGVTGESDVVTIAFAEIAQKFVKSMSNEIDKLASLPPIWLLLQPLRDNYRNQNATEILRGLNLLEVICGGLCQNNRLSSSILLDFLPTVTVLACQHEDESIRAKCTSIVESVCCSHTEFSLQATLPVITGYLEDRTNDPCRISGCHLLEHIVHGVSIAICPFVRRLLRIVMSLMADPIPSCAKTATSIFASLVRVAPLVQSDDITTAKNAPPNNGIYEADSVVDHLIHGKPLPPYRLPQKVQTALTRGGITLRPYQMEGIAWLRFLQSVKLNGALCDSMGLGKTLQALVGVAISHVDADRNPEDIPKSLVICPSSVVGHWEAEIEKFFPDKSMFRSLAYIGTGEERKALREQHFTSCNIVVTSYSVLRSDVDTFASQMWRFVILDEGHLLKNPKTATARASRRLRAHHKLILSGTPVQNKVQEVFATFDFLMPNFLGSSQSFAKEFARPITKSHLPGATAENINTGMEQLKLLHQQVLPFILRREKEHVLKDLPPKVVSTVPCEMSPRQRAMYECFLATREAKESIEELQRALQQPSSSPSDTNSTPANTIGSKSLKILLYLRLLCTHPSLVDRDSTSHTSLNVQDTDSYDISLSGKFLALVELLRACGIHKDEITGADNDTSLLYCDQGDESGDGDSDISNLLSPVESDGMLNSSVTDDGSKCIVFAQFTNSLDAVEDLLVKRHMPSLRYLRLDGRVPATKRTALVDAFNNDPSIKLMLLTTRVGGLGLNLTGADTVIFLENDYNPFADLQAADRAHRIGQSKTVNVYRLVTKDSIEEKIMSLQEKKIALSNAIVNTDNSSLFSMGTDRLLDIFTCRSDSQKKEDSNGIDGTYNLDALVESYKSEYSALSVNDFLKALQT